jgi:hypothetical protein
MGMLLSLELPCIAAVEDGHKTADPAALPARWLSGTSPGAARPLRKTGKPIALWIGDALLC